MSQVLYHITKKKHLPRILKEGLLPGKKSRRVGLTSSLKKEKWDRIFLTDDIQYIINTQVGYDWMDNAAVIEVNISGLKIEKHFIEGIIITDHRGKEKNLEPPNEFIFKGKISPDRLKLLKI